MCHWFQRKVHNGATRTLDDGDFRPLSRGLTTAVGRWMKCRYWLWRPLRDRRVCPRVTYRIPVGVICQFRTTGTEGEGSRSLERVTRRNASFVHGPVIYGSESVALFQKQKFAWLNVYWIHISEYVGIFLKVLSLIYLGCPENVVKMLVRHLNASSVRKAFV